MLVAACAPPPAPPVSVPEVAAPVVAVAEPAAVPVPEASTVPPGAMVFYPAIVSDTCGLIVNPLAGGGVAVRCDGRGEDLYAAAGGQAMLTHDEQYRAWLEEWDEDSGVMVVEIGGRWPDAMFATVDTIVTRATTLEKVIARKPEGWVEVDVRASQGRSAYYTHYTGSPDGQVFALRVQQPTAGFYYPTEQYQEAVGKRLPPSPLPHRNDSGQYLDWIGRPAVDRLAGEGPKVPQLSGGTVALDLQAGPAGDLYVQVKGGRFLHAAPAARAWKRLPAVGEGAPGKELRVDMTVGLDGRLYVERCPKGEDGAMYRWDGAGWTGLGIPCLSGFVVREDGSMWRVESLEQGDRLVRLAEDGAWTAVPVYVPGEPGFEPDWLMAVPGGLWLEGRVGSSREVLATTLTGGTVISLAKN